MKAYHDDLAIKQRYLARVAAHRAADEIVQGRYWEDGKGCAVGCTIHGSNHAQYEAELGIPESLAHLEDRIFEGMDAGDARAWPHRFLSAIGPGADLSRVSNQFLAWLLTEETPKHFDATKFPDVARAISACADLHLRVARGEIVTTAQWSAAAESAARAAAESAARSAAARAAWSAAWSAAESAAWSAAARAAAFKRMGDRLIELLSAAS